MFSCEYRKDLNHNYLIITETINPVSLYEKEMFLKNEIKGLLPCHIRSMNSQTQYYYEISSKQAFESAFFVREINFTDLKNMFFMLSMVIREMQKYLLDHSNVILNPKYIYIDLETNQLFFLYYPCQTESLEDNIAKLVDYLLEKVNHKDNQAVDFVYWLYDYSRKEEVAISKILDYLEQKEEVKEQKEQKEQTEISTAICEPEKLELSKEKKEEGNTTLEPKKLIKLFLFHIGLPILLEVVTAKLLFLFFEFTQKELLLLFGGYAVITAVGMILLYTKVHEKSNLKGQTNIENIEEHIQENTQQPMSEHTEEDAYGVTTFLGADHIEQQKILIGKMRGKEIEIGITDMPFVIGKMKDSVNYVLNDASISRMHVKFFQKDDKTKVYMVDLNSTNGTFKNGVQVETNEEVVVSPEDEIQIGKLKFTYH